MTVRGKQTALALLLGLAFTAPAQAGPPLPKVITVCPGAGVCDFTSIDSAANDIGTNSGDGIEVYGGNTYHEQVNVQKQLDIFGRQGDAPPVITWDGVDQFALSVKLAAAGTTLRRLDIRETATDGAALEALGAITASDLALTGVGSCAILFTPTPSQLGPNVTATLTGSGNATCVHGGEQSADILTGLTVTSADEGVSLEHGATLTDSTVRAAGTALEMEGGTARRVTLDAGGFGLFTFGGTNLVSDSVIASTGDSARAVRAEEAPGPNAVTLRNVTAIASGNGSRGLEAVSFVGPSGTGAPATIDARNVIARGSEHDVFATLAPASCPMGDVCQPGVLNIDHSNFVTASGNVLTPADPHNQSTDPLFVNGILGPGEDFHLASGVSPAIGAGIADASNGPTDRDGVAHPNPPTIGAYERAPASPAGPGGTVVSNSLKFGRVKVGRDGTITITAQVGAAGPVSATATTKPPAHLTSTANRKKKKPKSFTYGKASNTAKGAGTLTLKIHPSKKAKKLLRRGARLKVAIKLHFSPVGAARNTKSKTVHVKLKHKRKRR